jgi:hypothetical protein
MKFELTKEELEKLYQPPPFFPEKETEFQRAYRMGRNSLILELIEKIEIDKVGMGRSTLINTVR